MQPQLTSFLTGKSISCCLSSGTESLYPEPVYKYSSMHIMSDKSLRLIVHIHSDLDLHSKNGGFCFMRYIIYIITQSCLIKHKTKILMYMNLLQYLKRPNLFAKSSEVMEMVDGCACTNLIYARRTIKIMQMAFKHT